MMLGFKMFLFLCVISLFINVKKKKEGKKRMLEPFSVAREAKMYSIRVVQYTCLNYSSPQVENH